MKITYLPLASLFFLAGPVDAKPEPSEIRPVAAFKSINLKGMLEVDVVVGKAAKVEIKGAPADTKRVSTTVTNGVLELNLDLAGHKGNLDIEVEITVPALESATISGMGELDIEGLTGPSFTATITGMGELDLAGSIANLVVDVKGTGEIDAKDLKAQSATVTIGGTGHATINASKSLAATISGVGAIEYLGTPAISRKISGTGTIDAAGADD